MSGSTNPECPFCSLRPERILEENDLAVAVADAFPVSAGHTLIIPRRHAADFFELSAQEVSAMVELLHRMWQRLLSEGSAGGFNVGVNVGLVAGQSVMHTHIHLIPRYPSDVADPTGGVRNVIPDKGRYA